MDPKIIIHGGAGKRPKGIRKISLIKKALEGIIAEAYRILQDSTAIEAVVYAITLLEDNPLFNAGTGSRLQNDGRARMTASLMDSKNRRFSAVINIEDVKNPIKIAYMLQGETATVLSGKEAAEYARKMGYEYYNPVTKERLREWRRSKSKLSSGTVGAVALDKDGCIAAGTSTGGRGDEPPGRVSDVGSPAGNYANEMVGISCTGIGELIIDAGLAVSIGVRVMDGMNLKDAVLKGFKTLEEIGGKAGIIAIDKSGDIYCHYNTDFMSYSWMDKKGLNVKV